jgi:predicted nucleic acid-binding protein
MEHVFVDTNIVIDLLQKRENFYKEAQELFTKADRKKLKLYISALTFANTYYILSKYYSSNEAKKILSKFKVLVEVLPTTDKIIDLALASDFNDFEDAIQFYTALESNLHVIITRNKKDFKNNLIRG